MNNKLLKEITVTVTKSTADELQRRSEFLNLSIGEVIDRMFTCLSTEDSKLAAALIYDYCGIVTHNQSEKQLNETLIILMSFCYKLLMDSKKYTPDMFISLMKENKNKIQDYIEELKATEE